MSRNRPLDLSEAIDIVLEPIADAQPDLLMGEDWATGWGEIPEPQLTPQNIEQDRYDRNIYQDIVEASPALSHLANQSTSTWPALMQDLWAQFYKMDPRLTDAEQVSTGHQVNRPFLERIREDALTEQTRLSTMLDDLGSAVATLAAGEQLLEEIEQRPELKDAMEKADQAAQKEAEGDQEGAEQLAQDAQQQLTNAARDLRRAVRAAMEAGQQEAQEAQEALGGWGMDSSDLQRMPMDERLEIVKRLRNPRLRRVADLVGRMKNLAKARQRVKLQKNRDEVHNITVGNDLQHLLPAELVQLRHPLLRLDWYRRYTERSLLQYQLRTREKVGRGPIVACVDCSGSMSGEPMDWAVAVTMALVDTAARQKRRCKVIVFNTQIVHEVVFAPGEKDAHKFADLASIGASGGTSYEEPLTCALETISASEYEKADVVMITDGLCYLADRFKSDLIRQKKARQLRIWTILIGYSNAGGMEEWCDQVWPVSQIADDAAGDVFENVY